MLSTSPKQTNANLYLLSPSQAIRKNSLWLPEGENQRYSATSSNRNEVEVSWMAISQSQTKIIRYNTFSHLSFTSRLKVLKWFEQVLDTIHTPNSDSIYHRFATLYDTSLSLLSKSPQFISSKIEFKQFLNSLFWISYKFEGYTINKLTLATLTKAFLADYNITKEEHERQMMNYEILILSVIDYNIGLVERNIYQITQMIITIIKNAFNISENLISSIINLLPQSNKIIQKDEKILFELMPIEKSLISILATIKCIQNKSKENYATDQSQENELINQEIKDLDNKVYNYLSNELKVIKEVNLQTINDKCIIFSNKLYALLEDAKRRITKSM